MRKPTGKRSRVDRSLDRIRNNRFAALGLVAELGVGALASFNDSVRKLMGALPSAHDASLCGQWTSGHAATCYPSKGCECDGARRAVSRKCVVPA